MSWKCVRIISRLIVVGVLAGTAGPAWSTVEQHDDTSIERGRQFSGACQWPDPPALAAAHITEATAPVFITHAPGDRTRMFIVDRTGIVSIYAGGRVLDTPFIDISDDLVFAGEGGLLGMAFHPEYSDNGRVFIKLVRIDGTLAIGELREYIVSIDTPDVVDPASARTIMEYPAGSIHVGGWIGFGPDGYLYQSTGDHGFPPNSADLTNVAGSILRIDINAIDEPYTIPPDNPFIAGDARGEIWAYGLRNPYRCAFDPITGDLWIADVGSSFGHRREEVNHQPAGVGGQDYGWPCMEGTGCTGMSGCNCPDPNATVPIYTYTGTVGCAIIGGGVYRGSDLPELYGAYIFGDFCTRKVWALHYDEQCPVLVHDLTDDLQDIGFIIGFGFDADSEMYIGSFGDVHKITRQRQPADLNGDGVVNVSDLLILLGLWGECRDPEQCVGDFNRDGIVNVSDLLILLNNWG